MTGDDGSADQEELLRFIKESRSFDFTGYKRSTLSRRIRKRMNEVQISDYLDYRDLLETNADEFTQLFNTILINVTSFFRDADAWKYLQLRGAADLALRGGPGRGDSDLERGVLQWRGSVFPGDRVCRDPGGR